MSERVDNAASAAVSSDADPSEGLGLPTPGAHQGAVGEDAGDRAVPRDERAAGGSAATADTVPDGATEGMRSILETEANRPSGEPDLSGLDPDDVPEHGPDAGHRPGPI